MLQSRSNYILSQVLIYYAKTSNVNKTALDFPVMVPLLNALPTQLRHEPEDLSKPKIYTDHMQLNKLFLIQTFL